MTLPTKTRFYTYDQNNSGGGFDGERKYYSRAELDLPEQPAIESGQVAIEG